MTRIRTCLLTGLLALWVFPTGAGAEVRAWLDRARIAPGESTTLNIETTDVDARPDYAPLAPWFRVTDPVSTRTWERVNGTSRARMRYAVSLTPSGAGVLTVPPVPVGGERTSALELEVSAEQGAPVTARGAVFIDATLDSPSPWLQQAVGYVVRLYFATPVISGELEQPPPDGATLRQAGADVQYVREIDGRQYRVVERRFLLVPERSGSMEIPAARFRGRGAGNLFDDVFGDGQRALSADGPARTVRVRPVPAGAPQPWLPLRAFSMRYLEAPRTARAGEAATVVVEAEVDGAASAQAPELRIEAPAGAQVFADPAQVDESMDGGRPSLRIVRRFSIVPSRGGPLQVAGPSIAWWDVQAGRARETALPDIALQVSGAAAPAAGGAQSGADGDADTQSSRWIRVPGVQGAMQPWALATVAFALLWLLTLGWALSRRSSVVVRPDAIVEESGEAPPRASGRPSPRRLREAIDTCTPAEIVALLQSLATPPVHDVDALRARLASREQVAALDALERARWHDGDLPAARQALRVAFAEGPRWWTAPGTGNRHRDDLPPLYEER